MLFGCFIHQQLTLLPLLRDTIINVHAITSRKPSKSFHPSCQWDQSNESDHFPNHRDEHTHQTSSQKKKETNIYLFFLVPLAFISRVINLSRSAARSHLGLLITAHSRWHNLSAFIRLGTCANANILHRRLFSKGLLRSAEMHLYL